MELYQTERAEARKRLVEAGRDPDAFTFEMAYLPPDPDGGGMFTLLYEVTVTHTANQKSLKAIGGIGWNWVDKFSSVLEDGTFD